MMHSCVKFYKCVLITRRCYEIADESLYITIRLSFAAHLMGAPLFDAAMKFKDKRRSFVWKRAIGPDFSGTGTAAAFALHKNNQDRKRIYHSKSRGLIEIGCSSLQACYDDESLDLMIQISLQEGVVIPDRHAAI